MPPSVSLPRVARAYALLLRAYPRTFRVRFGEAMQETFLDDHARVRAHGALTRLHFWLVTLTQALAFGLGERLRSRRRAASRGWRPLRTSGRWALARDARHAVRLYVRSPLFTLTATVSLAIGLAGATTIFSIADAMVLGTSAAVRGADRVVDISRTTSGLGSGPMSYPVLQHLRAHTRTLESLSATTQSPVPLSWQHGATSERVFGRTVSANFFDVLQTRPVLGRFFRASEDAVPEAVPVAVVSHRFWRERLGSDPGVLGRPLRLNRVDFTVIGVAEAAFDTATFIGTDLWVPTAMAGTARGESRAGERLLRDAGTPWLLAVGRLRPGVSREVAQAELAALLEAFKRATPAVPASHGLTVRPAARLPVRLRGPVALFAALCFVLTGGLLAIACSNVGGLLLARAAGRRHEMATRLAVGASRTQLLGQMLVETLLLFAAAGLVAIPLTIWMVHAAPSIMPPLPIPIAIDVPITWRSLLFAAGVTFVAGLVFGLAPARHAWRTDLSQMLHSRASTAGPDRLRLRQLLVVSQVALSLTLLITAGLLGRTLLAASHVDTGFRTADVDVLTIETTLAGVSGADAAPLVDRLVDRLRRVGGVESVGVARSIPLQSGGFSLGSLQVPGAGATGLAVDWDVVSPDYFRTIDLLLVSGRSFTTADRAGRGRVAIVNETLARTAWPGGIVLGQRIRVMREGPAAEPLEVVGIAKDAPYRSLGEPARPLLYVAYAQQPQAQVEIFVKHAPGRRLAGDLRAAIGDAAPGLPVVALQAFDEAALITMLPQRAAAWLAGCVGVLSVFLAILGLYGLVSFLVAQRTREIAIRIALGATQHDIGAMVLGQAARLGIAGALVGTALALGVGQLIARLSLLIGVEPTDPATFLGLGLALVSVLVAASAMPARRATRTDPATALRTQ